MKQQIVNMREVAWWQKQVGKYPGESIGIKIGKAKKNMICDFTGRPIFEGERCAAVSVVLQGQTAWNWESQFIEVDKA